MKKNLYLLFISTVLLLGFQSSIEERLYTLNRDLMCPVCDGLTLEQSQATPALEMKEEIKKMVVQGMSDKEIKNHFVAKFGVEILANPPKKGFDTLVWLAPLVFGFFGIVFLYRYIFS
tara:strand:+ start:171 stop:524 length:354 start_codon:yes stop_codon:yes gene_type:complete